VAETDEGVGPGPAIRESDGPEAPRGVLRVAADARNAADACHASDAAGAIADQVKLDVRRSQERLYVTTTRPETAEGQKRIDREVRLDVIVPRHAQVRVSQSFGDMRLDELDGTVTAVSNMGSIRAAGVRGQVALEANFGNIDFIAPPGLSAKVKAGAQMGSIHSDLPLEIARPDPFSMGSHASGTIGEGEGSLSLATNMGSIHIRTQADGPGESVR
jgi:hypothetical protein